MSVRTHPDVRLVSDESGAHVTVYLGDVRIGSMRARGHCWDARLGNESRSQWPGDFHFQENAVAAIVSAWEREL